MITYNPVAKQWESRDLGFLVRGGTIVEVEKKMETHRREEADAEEEAQTVAQELWEILDVDFHSILVGISNIRRMHDQRMVAFNAEQEKAFRELRNAFGDIMEAFEFQKFS